MMRNFAAGWSCSPSVQPSPQATSRAMERVRQTLTDPNRLQARKSFGRIIMNSKWTKLAAAAVIVVAVVIGLQFVGGSTVTFAQVIQPILNANTAVLDIIIGVDEPNTPVIHDMVMGSRIRRTMSNIAGNVSIIDLESGRILNLTEAKKEAVYIDLKGLPSMPNYMDQLRSVIVQLQDSPHFVVEDLGTRDIDGRKAVGFLAKHPRSEITIWADAKTGLPIRIDQKDGQMIVIAKNMQFDAPMDEALFSMEVPEGYKLQQMQIWICSARPRRTSSRVCGSWPRSSETGSSPTASRWRITSSRSRRSPRSSSSSSCPMKSSLCWARRCSSTFCSCGSSRARASGTIAARASSSATADKAIFWYRPRGSKTYRVIYGDLHVADVAPENLPEPLAADDVRQGEHRLPAMVEA